VWADTYLNDPAHAYAHAMSDGTAEETAAHARTRYQGWVTYCLAEAKSRNSAWYLGLALHAIEDSFSPSHRGFQSWYGTSVKRLPANTWHVANEASLGLLGPDEWEDLVKAIKDAIFEELGAKGYSEATGYLYSRPKTYTPMQPPSYTPTPITHG
jgi:hypothetical protein